MKLYIYDHCPYCLKARMIFGLKNIPRRITCSAQRRCRNTHPDGRSKNRFPFCKKDDSRYMPESMDIVHYVDKLDGKPLLTGKRSPCH